MLTVDFDVEQEGMTVPYGPLFDEIRSNHGFVDLRGRPDLAVSIAEGSGSAALKALLVEFAEPGATFFTLGCDLGAHEEPWQEEAVRQVAGGYVQFMCADYDGRSPEDYTTLGHSVAQMLEGSAQDHEWSLYFRVKPVVFNLDNFCGLTLSLDICFFAAAATAEAAVASHEDLLSGLHRTLTHEHLSSDFR
jgi:hypothetical protein